MIKSNFNINSFLIIYFVTLFISILFPLIIFGLINDLNLEFTYKKFFQILLFLLLLLYLWRYFIISHTRIKITDEGIEFIRLFKSSIYKWRELNYYFERMENTRYGNHQSLFIVKNSMIVQRISEFEYSNYENLKKNLRISKVQKKIGLPKILRFMIGFETKI